MSDTNSALIKRMVDRWKVKFGPASIDPLALGAVEAMVREKRPKAVLEFGSGISTYFWRELMDDFPDMQVYSVESSGFFLGFLPAELRHPNLHVIHAPLTFWRDGLRFHFTYDHSVVRKALKDVPAVDLILVDGPWGFFGRDAPLFLVLDKLKADTVVLLDDAARKEEVQVVARWQEELGAEADWLDKGHRIKVVRNFVLPRKQRSGISGLVNSLALSMKKKVVYHLKEKEMHFR
jgi:hypothetical protein